MIRAPRRARNSYPLAGMSWCQRYAWHRRHHPPLWAASMAVKFTHATAVGLLIGVILGIWTA